MPWFRVRVKSQGIYTVAGGCEPECISENINEN